jgi:hypothetical protein
VRVKLQGLLTFHLDTRHAMRTALGGRPTLRVARCARWPERQACGQDCLREPQNQLTLHTVQDCSNRAQ